MACHYANCKPSILSKQGWQLYTLFKISINLLFQCCFVRLFCSWVHPNFGAIFFSQFCDVTKGAIIYKKI
jgi:hypothetical protein